MNCKIMKLKLASLLVFMSVTCAVIAADAPRQISIAVFDFDSPYRVRLRNDIGLVSSLLTADLSSNAQFTLVDRAQLKKIMKEQALGLSGEISPETAAKIGRLVGAKILVTGQIFNVGDTVGTDVITEGSESQILIIVKVIGTETGRFFAQRQQGLRKDLVGLSDDLSKQIAQIINTQYTNLVADETVLRDERIAQLVKKVKGKKLPAVSIEIKEQFLSEHKPGQTVQSELGRIFKQAGFEVVDEKSDKRPDVEITGEATSSVKGKIHGLIPGRATVSVKAQERTTGKILAIDRQDGHATDLDKQTSVKNAFENAADDLAERLLPLLAQ